MHFTVVITVQALLLVLVVAVALLLVAVRGKLMMIAAVLMPHLFNYQPLLLTLMLALVKLLQAAVAQQLQDRHTLEQRLNRDTHEAQLQSAYGPALLQVGSFIL
jgi:hypothetical protein